jgi:hypothetical protein
MPCTQGEWYAKHNNYMSYGPQTARLLNSQWMINAVSGIGITHSYGGGNGVLPPLYDSIADRSDPNDPGSKPWDFAKYQPDVITICLGQNDGVKYTSGANASDFISKYEAFIDHLHAVHPKSQLILLTSPMGDAVLTADMKDDLNRIVNDEKNKGNDQISSFSRSWNDGCDGHPTVASHIQIAAELAPYIKKTMNW